MRKSGSGAPALTHRTMHNSAGRWVGRDARKRRVPGTLGSRSCSLRDCGGAYGAESRVYFRPEPTGRSTGRCRQIVAFLRTGTHFSRTFPAPLRSSQGRAVAGQRIGSRRIYTWSGSPDASRKRQQNLGVRGLRRRRRLKKKGFVRNVRTRTLVSTLCNARSRWHWIAWILVFGLIGFVGALVWQPGVGIIRSSLGGR